LFCAAMIASLVGGYTTGRWKCVGVLVVAADSH
jgi:hypothetical protein